jgi:glycosyltransferase involved in cell wall biosynthesis
MNPSGGSERVAICMATFDPPPELFRRQIDSIRTQTHENWVCLISDDDSSPDSAALIAETVGDDPRFTVQRNPQRLGVYRNFERVLGSVPADAGLVALADQDDRWEPEKLASLAQALAGGATLAYSDARITDPDGRVVSPTFWTSRRNNSDDLGSLVLVNSITGAASLFRRDLLDRILPLPDPEIGLMHDHWIAMVAMTLGDVAYLDRPLYDYVQHPHASLGHEGHRDHDRPRLDRSGVSGWLRRGYLQLGAVRDSGELLLRRGGESITPEKRRILRRCARVESSPASWAWLAWLAARSPIAGSRTVGAERFLLGGLLWRAGLGTRKLLRLPPPAD